MSDQQPKKFKVVPKGKGTDGDGGVAGIRKRIRDAERLLRRPKIQATAKQDLERRIKALNRELVLKTREVNENEVQAKYKFVKHLERKKVLKKITKLEKSISHLEEDEDAARQQLTTDLNQQRINLAYIEFYPKDMKYISLFPTTTSTAEQTATATAQESSSKNKKKRKTVEESAALNSDELRNLIQDAVKKAVESGEAKKANFAIRMREVLDDEQTEAYLAQTKLVKKVKTPIVVIGAVAGDGGSKDVSEKKYEPKGAKDKKQENKSKIVKEEEEEDEDDNGEDDFFLTGDDDGEAGGVVEQIDPEDFFVERAVKPKKGPKDAGFRPTPKGKIRK
ncbi:UNVERIFIED_CONTAM: 18S rRNA maturation protein [Siphonaria sp. JEL0065]|nr:18S rRNA maturation protein [Siphonaria sp. JEL0065]